MPTTQPDEEAWVSAVLTALKRRKRASIRELSKALYDSSSLRILRALLSLERQGKVEQVDWIWRSVPDEHPAPRERLREVGDDDAG